MSQTSRSAWKFPRHANIPNVLVWRSCCGWSPRHSRAPPTGCAVASGILPDVEGAHLAARKKATTFSRLSKIPSGLAVREVFSAGLEATALRQAGCPPLQRSAPVSRAGRDQPQQAGEATGVKSFTALGDDNVLRLVSATQPRSADGLLRAKLFHLFDPEQFTAQNPLAKTFCSPRCSRVSP